MNLRVGENTKCMYGKTDEYSKTCLKPPLKKDKTKTVA